MLTKIALILPALLAALSVKVFATTEETSFRHLTMQDGLSSNTVNSTYRDARGFVWISTEGGLNRYDGYSIKTFIAADGAPQASTSRHVERVWDVSDDRLLVSTGRAFFIFDKRTETFTSAADIFRMVKASPATSAVMVDSRRDIWVADGPTCAIFSPADGTIRQGRIDGTSEARICSFFERDDKMYAAHRDGSVSVFARMESGEWRLTNGIDAPETGANMLYKIFADSHGNTWLIPTDGYGLYFRPRSSATWQKCDDQTPAPMRMPSFIINNVTEDSEGRIWVASNHGGINIIDLRAGECTEIRSHKNSSRAILSNSISDLYSDSQGCVWVGDVKRGLSVFGEPIYKFQFDDLATPGAPSDMAAQVNCIAEDGAGNMWYGTNDNGIVIKNARTGQSQILSHTSATPLPSDIVVSLCPDGEGGMWIGTFLGGMCHYDGRRLKRYAADVSVPKAASAGSIWAISKDGRGRLWVGSLGNGLAVNDPATGEWTQWKEADGLPSDYITKVTPVDDNAVAVGTSYGLCFLSLGRGTEIVQDSILTNGTFIVDLFYDSRGLLWACTNTGLHVIDGGTHEHIRVFNSHNDLTADATLGIAEDKRRVMWLSTSKGIASIDVAQNDTDGALTFRVVNYNDQDGTIVGSINERATICTADGEIIIGRTNGVDRFRPEGIKYNTERPVVTFTSLSTFGEETPIGTAEADAFHLPQALTYCTEIELPYDVNVFTVYFSTLSSILPEKVSYQYMLEGFSTGWMKTTENHVTYTNLSPGDYELRVRAANCDGKESEQAATLRITILPPWWRTTAAYIIYALLIIGSIVLSIKWIRDRDKAKFRLRQVMDGIEHDRKVDEMKLRFFTNISHELRTPLSLIVSPLENILAKMSDQNPDRDQLEVVHRNSLKLLHMVNQLLDFRKTDMGGMTLNLSEGDFAAFVEQNSEAYVALDKKDIKFTLVKEAKNIYISFDKDKIGKVVTNLLSNAYKFTPEGGQVRVTVGLSDDKSKAFIRVADTGIGIADEHKNHIFERFYQVPQSDSSIAGSGIGLHLVKDFVSMHGGTVSVSDNEGGGTVFEVMIPAKPTSATAEAKTDEPQPDAEPEESKGPAKKQIVIVDDNPDFLSLLRDTLHDEYDTLEAHNGQEAFALIEKTLPDLIITDIMMPIMDGNELCIKVKGDIRTSHIPLIMLTAKAAEEHNIEGLKNGADDYITKPFNPQILRLKVKKMVEQTERRQQTFKNQIEPEPSQITITTLDEQLIKKAIDYVEANIASPTLSVEDLSRALGMSRVHLYKKLTTITGRSPIEFIRVLRLKRAAQLLKDPAQNVADVAYAVGFNNPKYLTKYFKEEFGCLPSKYYQQTEGDKPKENPTDQPAV